MLLPYCKSERCQLAAGMSATAARGAVKDKSKVKNDRCLDCGHVVVWKRTPTSDRHFSDRRYETGLEARKQNPNI